MFPYTPVRLYHPPHVCFKKFESAVIYFFTSDPNAHIIWIENTDARLKVLRDVDAGMCIVQ